MKNAMPYVSPFDGATWREHDEPIPPKRILDVQRRLRGLARLIRGLSQTCHASDESRRHLDSQLLMELLIAIRVFEDGWSRGSQQLFDRWRRETDRLEREVIAGIAKKTGQGARCPRHPLTERETIRVREAITNLCGEIAHLAQVRDATARKRVRNRLAFSINELTAAFEQFSEAYPSAATAMFRSWRRFTNLMG